MVFFTVNPEKRQTLDISRLSPGNGICSQTFERDISDSVKLTDQVC